MSCNRYKVGDKVRVTGTFTDKTNNDALIDPTAVQFRALRPDGTLTTLLAVGTGVVRESLGVYYAELEFDQGHATIPWVVKMGGTGAAVAVECERFFVDPDAVSFA